MLLLVFLTLELRVNDSSEPRLLLFGWFYVFLLSIGSPR